MREDGRIKMSELAKRSGVPASTIKHYIREGLVPDTAVRTSRNMAWYDANLVGRIQAVKGMQRDRYLPLKVIKDILEREPERQEDAVASIAQALEGLTENVVCTRADLVADGMAAEEIDWLLERDIVTPVPNHAEEAYRGEDVALMRVLISARSQGLTMDILPSTVIQGYMEALRTLVRFEWGIFSSGLLADPEADATTLASVATRLSESLVIVLRRKILLPTLRESGLLAEGD